MKYLLLISSFVLLSLSASAQFILEFNSHLGFPMTSLKRTTTAKWMGLSGSALYQLTDKYPILAGVRADFQWYGYNWTDYDLPLNLVENEMVVDQFTAPLEIISGNCSAGLHAMIQVEAPTGTWVPYIRGLLGARRWWTYARVFDRGDDFFFDFYEDEEMDLVISGEIINDYIFSWGGGAGIQIYLNENKGSLLHLGFTYLQGSRANFFDRRSTESFTSPNLEANSYAWDLLWEDINVAEPVKSARANLLSIEVGVQIPL